MSMSRTWPPLLLAGHRFLFLILLLHRMRHSVPLALALSTLEGARQCKGFQSCLAHSQLSVPSDEQSLRHVCVTLHLDCVDPQEPAGAGAPCSWHQQEHRTGLMLC